MTHTLEMTSRIEQAKEVSIEISELIDGKDVSASMLAMTLIIGSMGAAFFDEDKEDFMERVVSSVSMSYDSYMEDHDG